MEFERFEFLNTELAAPLVASGRSTCSPTAVEDQHRPKLSPPATPETVRADDEPTPIALHPTLDGDNDGYGRWARFENGNVSPPPVAHPEPPEAEPGETDRSKRLTRGEEIEEIFQQLNRTLKENVATQVPVQLDAPGGSGVLHTTPTAIVGQLVENVPVIESILDDLLTFSKQLLERAQTRHAASTGTVTATTQDVVPVTDRSAAGRKSPSLTEINDDDLINLLADGDDTHTAATDRGHQDAVDKSRNGSGTPDVHRTSESPCASIGAVQGGEGKSTAASERNGNQSSTGTEARPHEDIFTNVAIFNWNPLDAYQHHGLFMIDPRLALADMRADISPSPVPGVIGPPPVPPAPLTPVPEETDGTGQDSVNDSRPVNRHRQPPGASIDDGDSMKNDNPSNDDGINNSPIITNVPPPPLVTGGRQNVNHPGGLRQQSPSFEGDDPHRGGDSGARKIVQMNQVLHCYDSCHVRYPVTESTTPEGQPDNEPHEGLKRVAWPPPAEGGEYEVHPSQQKQAVGQQIPLQQQQQPPQQFYHQPVPQQQQQQQQQHLPHPTYQPSNVHQQHQQQQPPHRPVERIIPIQRPEDQQQPLAPQYQHLLQQQHTYQPQPTEAFQPLTGQQQQQPPTPSARTYQPIQPPQQQQQQLPPTLVTTLRKEPPMSQEPAPVYQTQPVAAIYQGGSNMRGDQKWPPEEYKRQSEVDNEERRRLAQEPAFRPRRQQKDYAGFFAKNALNNTYPGYRAPPGTQHHA
ncbi:RNA-binding protein 33 isoform X2 [Anopheles cruzii]|uniref:RNA-binding protein 33 isoform X2 n=1 Tax=Anopheles cruzii TaxID=68878 RepID=UPI0022EC5DB3|nr:RNA-binding protein 33 isoform X2 [Anopheles cruzii]